MKNKIAILFIFLAGIFVLSSCLKDDHDYWKDDVAGKMYATFLKAGFRANSLQIAPDDVIIEVAVNIATDAVPGQATTLTFEFDDAAIAAYDSTLKAAAIANGDTTKTAPTGVLIWNDYKPYPGAELLDPTITIPAGSRTGVVRFKVNRADTVQVAGNYMKAITITSASGGVVIAENVKTVLVGLPIANAYEGQYLSQGFRNHPSLGILPFDLKLNLTTVDLTTVKKTQAGDYTGYNLQIQVTSNTINVGGVDVYLCNLQLDDGAANVGTVQYSTYKGDPMNYYNPVTKTFELYYSYNATPRYIRETNTRL